MFRLYVVNKRIEQQKRTKAIRYILLSWKCVSQWRRAIFKKRSWMKIPIWMSWTLILNFFCRYYINTVIMCTFLFTNVPLILLLLSTPSKLIPTKHTHFIPASSLVSSYLLYPPTVYLLLYSRKSSFNFIITH